METTLVWNWALSPWNLTWAHVIDRQCCFISKEPSWNWNVFLGMSSCLSGDRSNSANVELRKMSLKHRICQQYMNFAVTSKHESCVQWQINLQAVLLRNWVLMLMLNAFILRMHESHLPWASPVALELESWCGRVLLRSSTCTSFIYIFLYIYQ